MATADSLARIFKAYDVRGIVPDELDERGAYAIGAGLARFVAETTGSNRLLVARDMRESGVALARAFIAGATSLGASVTDLGLASTDLLYFASGSLDAAGTMLTASHNPAAYNGFKFCLPGARPIGEDSGLFTVRDYALEAYPSVPEDVRAAPAPAERRDLLDAFADHVHSFVEVSALAPFSVIADTANGMGGLVAPRIFEGLPFHLEVLFGDLDGNFPNHPADPIQEENLKFLRAAILEGGADVGLAFDGDADRVFLVDEAGVPLSGSLTTAIVAKAMLEKHPGATILYNCICSKAVPEVIAENGGTGIRTRVGHSFIKGVMAETGAVFGGEHSGHYYFADNYRADSGIIAALVVLELLSRSGTTLSELRRPFERYSSSGEINSTVTDPDAAMREVVAHYEAEGAKIDFLDGLTADLGSWWFNLRRSNTEPLLRLNVEAATPQDVAARADEVLALVRK